MGVTMPLRSAARVSGQGQAFYLGVFECPPVPFPSIALLDLPMDALADAVDSPHFVFDAALVFYVLGGRRRLQF